jgi:hypothetical protein
MSFLNLIPNPFDKNSTISGKEKKLELINEKIGALFYIRNIIVLTILGIILSIFTKFPLIIIVSFIGVKIITDVVIILIQKKEIEAIDSIDTNDNAKSLREILIIDQYWELIKLIVGFVGNSFFVSLIFVFFYNVIINFLIQKIPEDFPIKASSLVYFILILIIYRVFQIIVESIKYNSLKNLKKTDDFAELNKEISLVQGKFDLLKNIPGAVIILFPFYFMGIPLWVPSIFAGIILVIIVLSIIELKRINSVNFSENNGNDVLARNKIECYQGEQIANYLFGIIKIDTGFSDAFRVQGFEFLGKGKNLAPENSLVITNFRLLLIQVPVSGGDNIVGGMDYTSENFFYNRGRLVQDGEELLRTKNISQIFELGIRDISYEDVKAVTLQNMPLKIIIEKMSEEKIGYGFMDKERYESIRESLQFYLKDKFVEN